MNTLEKNWLGRKRYTKIPAVIKRVNYGLRSHQTKVRDFMKTRDRLLIVHGTGTGKTLTAAYVAKDYLKEDPKNNNVIFVTPPAVSDQFKRSVSTVLMGSHGVYFTTYAKLRLFLNELYKSRHETLKKIMKTTMIIADEAHYITEPENKRIFKDVMVHADKMVLMTATPISTGEWSDLLVYAQLFNPGKTIDANNIVEMMRCKISIVLDYNKSNFPKQLTTRRIDFPLTMNQAQNLNSQRMLKGARRWTGLGRNIKSWSFDRGILSNKIFSNPNENPKHIAFYKIYKKNPTKTIVFFQEKATLEKFAAFLRERHISYIPLLAETKNKSNIVSRDPVNSKSVFLLMPSGKEGLDFKGVKTLIFMDIPWTAIDYNQIVGRAIRYRSHANVKDKTVRVYNFVYTYPTSRVPSLRKRPPYEKITIDQRALELIKEKRLTTEKLFNKLKRVSIEQTQCPDVVKTRSPNTTNRLKPRPNRRIVLANNKPYAYNTSNYRKRFHLENLNVPFNLALGRKTKRSPSNLEIGASPPPAKRSAPPRKVGPLSLVVPRFTRTPRK